MSELRETGEYAFSSSSTETNEPPKVQELLSLEQDIELVSAQYGLLDTAQVPQTELIEKYGLSHKSIYQIVLKAKETIWHELEEMGIYKSEDLMTN